MTRNDGVRRSKGGGSRLSKEAALTDEESIGALADVYGYILKCGEKRRAREAAAKESEGLVKGEG